MDKYVELLTSREARRVGISDIDVFQAKTVPAGMPSLSVTVGLTTGRISFRPSDFTKESFGGQDIMLLGGLAFISPGPGLLPISVTVDNLNSLTSVFSQAWASGQTAKPGAAAVPAGIIRSVFDTLFPSGKAGGQALIDRVMLGKWGLGEDEAVTLFSNILWNELISSGILGKKYDLPYQGGYLANLSLPKDQQVRNLTTTLATIHAQVAKELQDAFNRAATRWSQEMTRMQNTLSGLKSQAQARGVTLTGKTTAEVEAVRLSAQTALQAAFKTDLAARTIPVPPGWAIGFTAPSDKTKPADYVLLSPEYLGKIPPDAYARTMSTFFGQLTEIRKQVAAHNAYATSRGLTSLPAEIKEAAGGADFMQNLIGQITLNGWKAHLTAAMGTTQWRNYTPTWLQELVTRTISEIDQALKTAPEGFSLLDRTLEALSNELTLSIETVTASLGELAL